MRHNLDQQLMQAKTRLRSKQKLLAMLAEARRTVNDEQSRRAAFQQHLADEKADVDKLEGLSLAGLFYSVLGTKEQTLEKERQEFLAAKLKYEESVLSLQEAEQEVQRLEGEVAPLAKAETEFEELLKEKERLLADAGDERTERLLVLSEQLADRKADRRELNEAIGAGQSAWRALQQVQAQLQSAANWGTWDMLGGGALSTMAKHSKIDAAKQHAHVAQHQLRRFQEELADAGQRLQVSLEIGGFSKFADFFFDGLISDWVVQSRIQEASSACSSASAQVQSAVDQCRKRLADVESEVEELERFRQEFIEQA